MPGPWERYQRQESEATSGPWERFAQPAVPALPAEQPNAVERFAEGAWKHVNPAAAVESAASAASDPVGTLKQIGEAQGERLTAAQEAWKRGDYVSAARHAIEYAIPLLGPSLGSAGDKMASGDVAGGMGETAGAAAAMFGPKVAARTTTAVKDAARSAAANPIVQIGAEVVKERIADRIPIVGEVRAVRKAVQGARAEMEAMDAARKARRQSEVPADVATPKTPSPPRSGAVTPSEMLAEKLDEAVDETTRKRLEAKLTPEQLANAEELAAAMGQPAGQRPSLGKGVIDNAKVGAEIEATNRTAQAQKMAEKLKEHGITSDMAARMNADQWRKVQYAAGADPKSATTHLEKPPSAKTQAEAIDALRKMERSPRKPK